MNVISDHHNRFVLLDSIVLGFWVLLLVQSITSMIPFAVLYFVTEKYHITVNDTLMRVIFIVAPLAIGLPISIIYSRRFYKRRISVSQEPNIIVRVLCYIVTAALIGCVIFAVTVGR